MTPSPTIPNLLCVYPARNIWRGGQPTDWTLLNTSGFRVIKLNLESEGSDQGAVDLGIPVFRFPISLFWQILFRPAQSKLVAIVDLMKQGNVFVHCEHGQDRTGLAVGCFRLSQGWSKDAAYAEMLATGFHPALQGLQGRWDSEQPTDWIMT